MKREICAPIKNGIFIGMNTTTNIDSAHATLNLWVQEFAPSMRAWAMRRINDKEVAEDLVQDTFVAALQSFQSFEGKSNPKTWLFSILKHKILDYFRKKYKQNYVLAGDLGKGFFEGFFNRNSSWNENKKPQNWDGHETELLDDENFRAVLKLCMKLLPELWLSAVSLKYLEEKKGPEICEDLGISQANFWQILHRAKLQLRECINNEWFVK
ncbi:MAG: sigma-70 family RNA polymerase sigma factor [Bacteroidetes bacterium]|nr:sigma-70 family RNA polymerase sigma factor [Bacteroidota bacterium]